MTATTLVWIIIWLFLIAFAFGLFFVTYLLGKRSIKDKAELGAVFVKTGLHISKPIKAKQGEITSNGCYFNYGKKKIFVPAKYQEHYYCNRRLIFVNRSGQLVASPFASDIGLNDAEKESLIYELCASHIGADAMRALKGKSTTNIIIIAIVAFLVGVAIMFAFTQFQAQSALNKAKQTTTQQSVPAQNNLPKPIEVK